MAPLVQVWTSSGLHASPMSSLPKERSASMESYAGDMPTATQKPYGENLQVSTAKHEGPGSY